MQVEDWRFVGGHHRFDKRYIIVITYNGQRTSLRMQRQFGLFDEVLKSGLVISLDH
jgi:hypothetical protein